MELILEHGLRSQVRVDPEQLALIEEIIIDKIRFKREAMIRSMLKEMINKAIALYLHSFVQLIKIIKCQCAMKENMDMG